MSRALWDEEECLDYYGMLSLHRLFEVVGAQLTPSDVAVLSFLLDETLPAPQPLDPSLWDGDPPKPGRAPRGDPRAGLGAARSGAELLLELERRGLCHEGDLGQLRQLLRVPPCPLMSLLCLSVSSSVSLWATPVPFLSLLCPLVPPLSPERPGCVPALGGSCPSAPRPRPQHWETGSSSSSGSGSGKRKRSSRNSRNSRNSRRTRRPLPHRETPPEPPEPPAKVTCDIRLRVRAEYCEHERALRRGVASSRPRGPGRALDVFGQASGVLKSRDLGSILCDIKFSELSYLEAFWGDYLSGALLEALKGVFLTEGLRRAVGREDVRLLVSVDQDDYELFSGCLRLVLGCFRLFSGCLSM
ncbi:PREDICTED: DNA-binding death effector domain-containing protein 2-like [Pseudopodoces humilis]|uniref:DNA-binding death effector domain-containing protein 2-like n=1 Tax=Pseudopodoces humilis TaxID=181119 RepID=UPI0006B85058|nr:PREDICTED: DNA-binding death effector domain-containing protein 2-like [Pseudopodoces humilis]